jgi:demethylmenaquinone methyltransferase/2-methoxy-6-polyprenyl-1,4-benzoquinol methylase
VTRAGADRRPAVVAGADRRPAVVAGADRRPAVVAEMFDGVAARYDRTNTVLSLGLDAGWRGQVFDAVAPSPGDRVLDVAAGTGTSSGPFAAAGARVVACDFSPGMLAAGRRARPTLAFVAGDALALPFADGAFDAVTISFGLRNTADPAAALRELSRVTRRGGRLVICEFSTPVNPLLRAVYQPYLMRLLPPVARAVATNPDAYVYLAESVRAWPDQRALAATVAGNGWSQVAVRNLSGGIVALHRAVRRGLRS